MEYKVVVESKHLYSKHNDLIEKRYEADNPDEAASKASGIMEELKVKHVDKIVGEMFVFSDSPEVVAFKKELKGMLDKSFRIVKVVADGQ